MNLKGYFLYIKKIWDIIQYVILFLLILCIISAISLGDLGLIFKGILLTLFLVSMIFKNKATKENKTLTTIYQASGAVIVILTIMSILFGFKF